ncbi:Tetratricopeptide repeat protein [Plesiocystis pacifica SIR-1]|uniref:Tetratricopeptide repeat protein n=1 Tax=Plesiocystis pacifica SIR-1 TaxID=391625 RepID=A6FZP8_9BACT|nr:multiheme c-type cytochrome [Plesiocystis pacifica]EDM80854.1 Tetratricopeptide repeat protein [Plesiocystis pacifica SIR-1]
MRRRDPALHRVPLGLALALSLCAGVGLACSKTTTVEGEGPTTATPKVDPSDEGPTEAGSGVEGPVPDARLPEDDGEFAPALTTRAPGPAPLDGHTLGDVDTCGTCHEQIVAQWRTSAHAYASFNNPIYRASIARFREAEGGPEASRFCAGCHDPALLVDGVMDTPGSLAKDPRAHVGVACRGCHGVAESRPDGNGSYTLASAAMVLPSDADGGAPGELGAHRRAVTRGAARDQCGACHRAFVGVETGHPHHLGGTDELGPWRDSSYSGSRLRLDTPVDEADCVDCHMATTTEADPAIAALDEAAADAQGRFVSHRFLGGHSYLAAMRDDPQTLAQIQAFLSDVASVDVAAVKLDGQAALLGRGLSPEALALGGELRVDVVVRNRAVGHRFPGGTRDAQDTWIAVQILDAAGAVIGEFQDRPEAPAEVHRLRAGAVDENGALISAREVERLRAVAFDHTIGPRDAVAVRYALELPPGHRGVRVRARLLHRSRSLALAARTCEGGRSASGQAALRTSAERNGERLDPCATPPTTAIAEGQLALGELVTRPDTPAAAPDCERLWELGVALSHQLQERLPEAREALEAALEAAERELDDPARLAQTRARILATLGAVAARQGRVEEALTLADQVEALMPDHPYPDLLRGRALAKVWRWEQAIEPLERAFERNPESPGLASELATALGSANRPARALAVAQAGLALRPRDEALLRSQALALAALHGEDDPRAKAALDAYFAHRRPDDEPHLAADCGRLDPACALERVPVHVHRRN